MHYVSVQICSISICSMATKSGILQNISISNNCARFSDFAIDGSYAGF